MKINASHQSEARAAAMNDIASARAWVSYRNRAAAKGDDVRVAEAQKKIIDYVSRAKTRREFANMQLVSCSA